MRRGRSIKGPVWALVAGLGFLVFGLGILADDEPTCGGTTMSRTDTCETVTIGPGDNNTRSRTSSYEGELFTQRLTGVAVVGLGILFMVVGAALVYRRTWGLQRTRHRTSTGRRQLAATHGWTYQEQHSALLTAWENGNGPPGYFSHQTAWDVLHGTVQGMPFIAFDVDYGYRSFTAVVVQLPLNGPAMWVKRRKGNSDVSFYIDPGTGDTPVSSGAKDFDRHYFGVTGDAEQSRAMLTSEVRKYVQEHRLSFALRGPWLTERTPVVSEPESLVSHLEALAGLVPLLARAGTADPSVRSRPGSGTSS